MNEKLSITGKRPWKAVDRILVEALQLDEATEHLLEEVCRLHYRRPAELDRSILASYLSAAACRDAIFCYPKWKWPRWVKKQADFTNPGHTLKAAHNAVYRTWTALGMPGLNVEVLADTWGEIAPGGAHPGVLFQEPPGSYAVSHWLRDAETKQLLAIGEGTKPSQSLLSGYIPVLQTRWLAMGAQVQMESFVEGVDGHATCFTRVAISNVSDHEREWTFFVNVRAVGPTGFRPIFSLRYLEELNAFQVDERLAIALCSQPDSFACSNLRRGDVCEDAADGELSGTISATDPRGHCTGSAAYRLRLEPGQTQLVEYRLAVAYIEPLPPVVASLREASYDEHHSQVVTFWDGLSKKGMQIRVPDRKAMECWKMAITNLHMMRRGRGISPGAGVYAGFWIRDAGMFCNALVKTGHKQTAERCLSLFPEAQDGSGYFARAGLTWENREWDFNGIALWALVQHYRYTQDLDWLRAQYPAIKRGFEFLVNNRRETLDAGQDAPYYGLLTPSRSEEAWGIQEDYYYWDDFWAICGMREAAYAAQDLGHKADAEWMLAEASDLSECTYRSIDRARKKRDLDFIPISPYRALDSAIIGSIAALYPCRVISPDDPRILATIDTILSEYTSNGEFFLQATYDSFAPIHAASLAHTALFTHQPEKAESVFYGLLRCTTPTNAWPEGYDPRTREGSQGDTPTNYAGAEYLLLLRDMLLFEDGELLWITPCLPKAWLADGETVSIQEAPTLWGSLSFEVTSHASDAMVELVLDPKGGEPPAGYSWRLRLPSGDLPISAEVDGEQTHDIQADVVRFPAGSSRIVVRFDAR